MELESNQYRYQSSRPNQRPPPLWSRILRPIISLRSAASHARYGSLEDAHPLRETVRDTISRRPSILQQLRPVPEVPPESPMGMKTIIYLVFALISIGISMIKVHAAIIFVLNLIAIVPLSVVLTAATESISSDLGPTVGALLNISFGNLAELIVFITALLDGHVKVVQSSLVGSILVNLLLVLGSSMIVGGLKYQEQTYNNDLTQIFIGLLNLTIFSLMIPTAFYGTLHDVTSANHVALIFSRLDSLILLMMYFLYMLFQFRSHAHLFGFETSVEESSLEQGNMSPNSRNATNPPRPEMQEQSGTPDSSSHPSRPGSSDSSSSSAPWFDDLDKSVERLETEHAQCNGNPRRCATCASRALSLSLLVVSTILIAICADLLVSSFTSLNERGILGESVVGLIILPIAGNVAEIITAATVAAKDQMDLAINIAVGSAIQIGLLLSPFMVLVGWIIQKDMSLHFDLFETVTLIAAVLLVSFLILKGRTNYFEGAMLNACFAAIAVGAYLLPDKQ